uniref:Uncharacterized protein n=1 Tax=Arundo donax TaxID=35708 RepID=A0A0A9D118_ARUDO
MAPNLDSSLCANVFLYLAPRPTIKLQCLQELFMLFFSPLLPLFRDRVGLPDLDKVPIHPLELDCIIHRTRFDNIQRQPFVNWQVR